VNLTEGGPIMRRSTITFIVLVAFALGAAAGVAWAKKKDVDAGLYVGVSADEAAANLLELAMVQAGKGSWERLRVARVYYLGGNEDEGQAIIDQITGDDPAISDWMRIGRIYEQADEWDRATEAFEKVLTAKPEDEDWLAEIGAYYNLRGEREQAEEYFRRSFAEDPGNERNTSNIAGSYIGIRPEF
jgi:tetratricopeptide (TPR) repeat protein